MANPAKIPPAMSPETQAAIQAAQAQASEAAQLAALIDEPEEGDEETDPEDNPDAPLLEPEWSFSLDFTAPNGKRWRGEFTHKMPTIRDRRTIGILQTQYNGHLPQGTLDPVTSELNFILANFGVTLDCSANGPGHWSHELEELDDAEVLYALAKEVARHEGNFLGHQKAQKAS